MFLFSFVLFFVYLYVYVFIMNCNFYFLGFLDKKFEVYVDFLVCLKIELMLLDLLCIVYY